jgi:hypothetical protein
MLFDVSTNLEDLIFICVIYIYIYIRRLGKPRPRWENNIEMDLKRGMDWIYLFQDRDQWRVIVNTVMNLRVP